MKYRSVLAALCLVPVFASATPEWSVAAFNPTSDAFTPLPGNVLARLTPSAQSVPKLGSESTGGLNMLTDGTVPTDGAGSGRVTIGNNAWMEYTLDAAYDLSEFRVYTYWGNADRNDISFTSLQVKTLLSPDAWVDIPNSYILWGHNRTSLAESGGSYVGRFGSLADAGGGYIAIGVTALRLNFGAQDNGYGGYLEIEASGGPAIHPALGAASCDTARTTPHETVLSVTVSDLGGDATSADVYLAYAPVGTDLPEASFVGTVQTAGATCTVSLSNLAEDTTYAYTFSATNTLGGGSGIVSGTFTTWTEADYALLKGIGGEVSVGDAYVTHVFATPGDFTFTASENITADILVVGGGGAGGWVIGGGGAGGAVRHLKGVSLVAGTDYAVTIGAGGDAKTWQTAWLDGGAGGDTTFDTCTAPGGAGGAAWEHGGIAGANGGGGSKHSGGAGTFVPATADDHGGYAGGDGINESPGGGAGAMGPGTAGISGGAAGNGGSGYPCDIIGETIVYGAGGGGGAGNSCTVPGTAGSAWAGDGGSREVAVRAGSGVNGTGSGGGGGAWNSGVNPGGEGGSGVVVIRYLALSGNSVDPLVTQPVLVSSGAGTLSFTTSVPYLGDGASACDLFAICTPADGGAPETNAIGTVSIASDAAVPFTVSGLAVGAEYAVSVVATNALGGAKTTTATTAATQAPSVIGLPGLLQGCLSGGMNIDDSMDASIQPIRRELGAVMGEYACSGYGVTYTSEIDGHVSAWGDYLTYIYNGYMYLEEGVSYGFYGYIDDDSEIKIDGVQVVRSTGCQKASGSYVPAYTGWHPVEVRVGNGYGGAGAQNASTLGIAYCRADGPWTVLKDTGDGSLLTCLPDGLSVEVVSIARDGDTVYATVRMNTDFAADLYAWRGADYASDAASDWDTVSLVASSATPPATAVVSFPVTDAEPYLRFVAVNPLNAGERLASGVLRLADIAPMSTEPAVSLLANSATETSASVSVAVFGMGAGATSWTAGILYGYVADALTFSTNVASGASVGDRSVTLDELRPSTTYYLQAVVTNNLGEVGTSDVVSFRTADEPAMGMLPGLLQGTFAGVWHEFSAPASSAANQRRELGPVMGLYPFGGTGTYTSELDGVVSQWSTQRTYVYTGYIYLESGTTYTFGMHQDDSSYLVIGGEKLIDTEGTWCVAQSGTYTPAATGWYPIDVRVGNDGGDAGNRNQGSYGNTGVGYSVDGGATWRSLIDPGDGSLLRTSADGATCDLATLSAARDGADALVVELSVGILGPCTVYAWYGPAYGGADDEAWANMVQVAVKSDIPAITLPIRLAIDADTRFVRFFAVSGEGGYRVTGETIVLPTLDEVPAVPSVYLRDPLEVLQGEATLPVVLTTPGAGADSCTLTLDFALADEDGTTVFTDTLLADGVSYDSDYRLNGLLPGRTYTVTARAVNSLGVSATTAPVTLTTLPESESLGILPGLWQTECASYAYPGSLGNLRRELGPAMGLLFANNGYADSYVSPVDGAVQYWRDNWAFNYQGYIWLKAGVPFTLGTDIDDSAVFSLDGCAEYGAPGCAFGSQTYTIERTGWHTLSLRVVNGGGQAGRRQNWIGVGYNNEVPGVQAFTYGWKQLLDAGDGALLVCGDTNAVHAVTVLDTAMDGTALVATVRVAVDKPMTLYAWYGADFGDASDAAWDHVAPVAVKSAEGTADLVARVPAEVGDVFVRFFASPSLDDPIRFYGETLVLRAVDSAVADPAVVLRTPIAVSLVDATLPVDVATLGADAASGVLTLEYGPAVTGFVLTNTVESAAVAGLYAAQATDLVPATDYLARARLITDQGVEVVSETVPFTTAAEPMSGTSLAGLWQGRLSGASNTTDAPSAATDVRRELGPVMGQYLASDVATQPYTSEIDGVQTYWADNTTFIYSGYMYMVGGRSYAFGTYIDDVGYLAINGTVLLAAGGNKAVSTIYVCESTGWYSIEIRVGNGGGKAGGNVGYLGNYGVAYNDVGGADGNNLAWIPLKDDGSGSLLRVSLTPIAGVTPLVIVESAKMEGDGMLIATVRVDVGEPVDLYAWNGPAIGGAEASSWAAGTAEPVAEKTESGTVTYRLRIPVADGTAYVRFAAVSRENPAKVWTGDTFALRPLERLGADPAVTIGDITGVTASSADVGAAVQSLGAGDVCDLSFRFGPTADALLYTQELATGMGLGETNAVLHSLLPGRDYFVQVCATNAAGGFGVSDIATFHTPALAEDDVEFSSIEDLVGLTQGIFDGVWNQFSSPAENSGSQRRELGPVMGLQPFTWNGEYTSEIDGVVTAWNQNRTFVYFGYIFLEGGTEYLFCMNQDDSSYLKIGDTVLIHSGNTYCAAFDATYTPVATGWYPIDLRLGNAGSNAGAYSSGYGGIGVGYAVHGSSWMPLKDPGDGSLLRVRYAARAASLDAYTVADGVLNGTLAIEGDAVIGTLYACYGLDYGDTDTNAWEHVENLGVVPVSIASLPYTLQGAGTEARYVRFALDLGEYGTCWGKTTVLPDASTPAFAETTTATELWRGDAVRLGATLLQAGSTGCTVTLEVSRNADLSDAFVWPVAEADSACDLSILIGTNDTESAAYIIPGATTYYRFRAVNGEGIVDATGIASFTTAAGSDFDGCAGANDQRVVTYSGTLSPRGANETTVWLYTGASADALAPAEGVAPIVIGKDDPADFSFSVTLPGYAETLYAAFFCSNACDTASWTAWSPVMSAASTDRATYYWKADVLSGEWSNPANWDKVPADTVPSFPNSAECNVSFANCQAGTDVRVHVGGSYEIYDATVGATGFSLTLHGDGTDVSVVHANREFTQAQDITFVVDAMLLHQYGWYSPQPGSRHFIRNGAQIWCDTEIWTDSDTVVTVEPGSSLGATSHLWIRGTDARLVIDDGLVDIRSHFLPGSNYGVVSVTNVVEFKGSNPKLLVYGPSDVGHGGAPQMEPVLLFHVPAGGYKEVPVQMGDYGWNNYPFLGANECAVPLRIEVAADSPAYRSGKALTRQKLLYWYRPGIRTDHLDIANQPHPSLISMYYTYDNDDTARSGTTTTSLWAELKGAGATVLLFR